MHPKRGSAVFSMSIMVPLGWMNRRLPLRCEVASHTVQFVAVLPICQVFAGHADPDWLLPVVHVLRGVCCLQEDSAEDARLPVPRVL